MFARYADCSKTAITEMTQKNMNTAALSLTGHLTTRSTTADEQTSCVLPEFTWTNGTTEGSCKGLNFIRGKVQRIFVSRSKNQYEYRKKR